jgi:uncharacterized protein (DUF427 family)
VRTRRLPHGVTPEPAGPGQASVWDYPRPPRREPTSHRLVVVFAGEVVADTRSGWRVFETSHPPGYYIPIADWRPGVLVPAEGASNCEWKGQARYYDVRVGDAVAHRAAWGYPSPTAGYATLAECVSVYPAAMDRCEVDGVRVTPQPGEFYGGWITPDVVGPFKGGPGSRGW